MSRSENASGPAQGPTAVVEELNLSLEEIVGRMRVNRRSPDALLETLPFSVGDTTVGAESELQALVIGSRQDVDLPLLIERSNYYANILRRAASGDAPRKAVTDLDQYLGGNLEKVWENSWVRFPRRMLSPAAESIFRADLLADKKRRVAGLRSDAEQFSFTESGEEHVRVPISYVLKLALADAVSDQPDTPPAIRDTGMAFLEHFLCDNTSPETHSFYVGLMHPSEGMGKIVAAETATRFLLTQLLMAWANEKFRLREKGQRAMVFMSPHPPVRQKRLNESISDAFYRELFMNPCLSGWDNGEAKYAYMHLCHEVLSRSQLNAVKKLREAGILTNNLALLPNLSNISLANNGTHVSLGSRKLTALLADVGTGYTRRHEKYLGDLVIKIVEHFMPLFVGTYSAAPYRIDFADFHPEKVLGYLPHEIDYTHLRMFWRRWKKKAKIKVFGRPVTPFGPEWIDRAVSAVFGLRGDFVPDFRLIDYLVSLMSTERSPALNGVLGNSDRLKKDLADLGIFSTKMSLYLLYKLREQSVHGFLRVRGQAVQSLRELRRGHGPGRGPAEPRHGARHEVHRRGPGQPRAHPRRPLRRERAPAGRLRDGRGHPHLLRPPGQRQPVPSAPRRPDGTPSPQPSLPGVSPGVQPGVPKGPCQHPRGGCVGAHRDDGIAQDHGRSAPEGRRAGDLFDGREIHPGHLCRGAHPLAL